MDQLVNKLTEVLQVHFGAKLVSSSYSMNSQDSIIQTMGGQSFTQFNGPPIIDMSLTVHEHGKRLFSESIRTGLFQELMGAHAKMVSCSTDMNFSGTHCTTRVNIKLIDFDALVKSIDDFSWTMYDKEFKALMDETLTE